MSLTFTDIFCGAGGSSIGLTAAGFELKLAANHWARAIETHSANFTDAEHLCADVSNYDMRRLPRTDILWASPICTEVSPAGGRTGAKTVTRGQLELLEFGPIAKAGFERTRATFHDVIRATEVHRYRAVLVENVVDVVAKWELFDWWVDGMCALRPGYNVQFVSVSSAHVGGEDNPHAPQWRDRLYLVFTQKGIPLPDVTPKPLAWCPTCEVDVRAVQSWRNLRRRKIGKYRQQYDYRCPRAECRHSVIEPYVLPAAAAIDWTDPGARIGDRPKPLAKATMRRIAAGLELFAQPTVLAVGGNTWERPGSDYVRAWPALGAPLNARTGTPGDAVANPFLLSVNHADDNPRAYPAHSAPLPTRTARIGDGVVTPPLLVPAGGTWNDIAATVTGPMRTRTARDAEALCVSPAFVTMLRNHSAATSLDEPLDTLATARHHALTVLPDTAFYVKNHSGFADPRRMVKPVTEPLGTITTGRSHALVIPYRKGKAKTTGEPLHTLATHDSGALVHPAPVEVPAVQDCWFRMLKPREHLRGQRFPDSYLVTGNQGEQTMQAGNAVSSNVAQWLAGQVAAVLAGRGDAPVVPTTVADRSVSLPGPFEGAA
jgi:DNA (cytosine-5)-methyltransferase 1